jgi:hypothetical protein
MSQPADPDKEERLGTRRTFWRRMRNRFGMVTTSTRHANEDPRTVGLGLEGQNTTPGNQSFR